MKDYCLDLHKLFNSMKRLSIKDIDEIKINNGIYIFFENGEKYHGYDRIVRVGTDTGQNNLKSRLIQHYLTKNKDRSIFRKNIGRAMLNRDGNPLLLDYWNKDLTKRASKEKFRNEQYEEECKQLESTISDFLDKNMTFVVFPLETKEERLRLEEAIISSLFHCEDFKASDKWLGNFMPELRNNNVKKSGMWLSQGLKASPLTDEEFKKLKEICEAENEDSIDSMHKE